MNKITFKETIVLSEARREDLKYTEKVVKNKIDRVIVELSGNESGVMSKLTGRYDRLDKAIKVMTVKRNEMNEQIKDEVVDLFNAEDVVLTRVVETISFTMTLSKLVKAADQDAKYIVNYEAIAKELAKLIPAELQEKVEEITKMYTEVSIAVDKSPALRIKSKVDESLTEGVLDLIKTLAAKVLKWTRSVASWAISYDKKLNSLKAQAAKPITEEVKKKSEFFIKFIKEADLNYAYGNFKKYGYVKKVDPTSLTLNVEIPGDIDDVTKLTRSLGIDQKNFSIKQ